MSPPEAGTFTGQDGQPYPMADDRSIEVPDDYVPMLLARGYTVGGSSDIAAPSDPESHSPASAIARLRAPAGAGSISAGGRSYDVAPDGTVDVQAQDIAELISAGCQYLSGQELRAWLVQAKREAK